MMMWIYFHETMQKLDSFQFSKNLMYRIRISTFLWKSLLHILHWFYGNNVASHSRWKNYWRKKYILVYDSWIHWKNMVIRLDWTIIFRISMYWIRYVRNWNLNYSNFIQCRVLTIDWMKSISSKLMRDAHKMSETQLSRN